MRGIGIGQKIHVFIIPEVRELIQRELRAAGSDSTTGSSDVSGASTSIHPNFTKALHTHNASHVLENIVAWLIINSMRTEQMQWTMLCIQNISNLYRKNAFKLLLDSVHGLVGQLKQTADLKSDENGFQSHDVNVTQAMKIFTEPLQFDLESGVPDPLPFEQKLRELLDENTKFLGAAQHVIGQRFYVFLSISHF
jgi:hypothetical protein